MCVYVTPKGKHTQMCCGELADQIEAKHRSLLHARHSQADLRGRVTTSREKKRKRQIKEKKEKLSSLLFHFRRAGGLRRSGEKRLSRHCTAGSAAEFYCECEADGDVHPFTVLCFLVFG